MLHSIYWPHEFTPGTTDNFCSNEIIVKGLTAAEVWPYLVDTAFWPHYYANASEIELYHSKGSVLNEEVTFHFTTFDLRVEAAVEEFIPPHGHEPGRIAWAGWVDKGTSKALYVYHAWLLEDLPGDRVRILTQESQLGAPAKEMAVALPNPMINAHQDWLNGLALIAKKKKEGSEDTTFY
ncbi:MAG: hypothetical protein ACRC3Z_04305 [Phocaeicola sp.]